MDKTPSREKPFRSVSGYAALVVALLCALLAIDCFFHVTYGFGWLAGAVGFALLAVFTVSGIYMLQPNQAALMMLFGSYRGTDRSNGLRWASPLLLKTRISLKARNFASEKLKVNDLRGNPIEIAAAIVWRVRDTAQASFDVDRYQDYIPVQAEAALRHLASSYPYDEGGFEAVDPTARHPMTLRSATAEVTRALMDELTDRMEIAGIHIEDAKLTHLAYAPEIAGVMLRRQQAEAIIAARAKIVDGAVSMVEMALTALSDRNIITLDDERKAAMVSNLLVVLCSDSDAQPVINAGTLYA